MTIIYRENMIETGRRTIGDRATVEVLITGPFGTREKSDVELRKINGRWKLVN